MSTFALSIVPDQVPAGPGGQMVKVDKSDPNKYLIPLDDARQIIRVATRSAYAEVCQLPELEKANFDALMRGEKLRGWTAQQMMFIHALHTFATSYFAGNVKITEVRRRPIGRTWPRRVPQRPTPPKATPRPSPRRSSNARLGRRKR